MRSLVEQTRGEVGNWLKNLLSMATALGFDGEAFTALQWLSEHSPIVLMGGEDIDPAIGDWDLYPEKPAIVVGTQDMLLSRALNRGYAMSRYRWPRHFGLLNNDCLWVCDEIQLMGPGVATASQLEAFRIDGEREAKLRGLGSYFSSNPATWYASATSSTDLLNTREWRDTSRPGGFVFSLSGDERADTQSVIGRRRHALKRLELQRNRNFGDGQPPVEVVDDIVRCHAAMVAALRKHEAPTAVPRRSLVICNTVDRAVAVFESLQARRDAGELTDVDLALLHSRFRPKDRQAQADRLKPEQPGEHADGQIVVSTQVIEAGVDLSSGILWTEAAPLSSIVQRLGRLNRTGEFGANGKADHGWTPTAIVVGIELENPGSRENAEDRKKREEKNRRRHLPYDPKSCDDAWNAMLRLQGDASPAALESIRDAIAASIVRSPYSLQRHELLDFFDTDSNLSLGYTDVSPFVRGLDDDTDVYVLWREWEGDDPNEHFDSDIGPDELCAVPIGRLTGKERGFANWHQGWLWLGKRRGKQGGWVRAADKGIQPGATLLLPTSAGGYDEDRGWTGKDKDQPEDLYQPAERPSDEDQLSWLNHGWRSIADHGKDVRDELCAILSALPDGFLSAVETEFCLKAALWHDLGKNHGKWKNAAVEALRSAGIPVPLNQLALAKFSLYDSPQLRDEHGNLLTGNELRRAIYRLKKRFRPGMAHEVASALALRQRHIEIAGHLRSMKTRDEYLTQLLAEYLVMSHHGQVRKVLRDEIPKTASDPKNRDTVRGVSQGDPLEDVTVDGETLGCQALSVDCRVMGRCNVNDYESYTRGVLRLLDHYGPFRLAYLEALIRAADGRASRSLSANLDGDS